MEVLLAAHGMPRSEVIFLAHRGSDAQSCAGSPGDNTTRSSNPVLGIAWASSVLRSDSAAGRDRRQAVELVERTLRNVSGGNDQDGLGLDERWLRDTAVRLAASLDPSGSTAKDFALALQAVRAGHTLGQPGRPQG